MRKVLLVLISLFIITPIFAFPAFAKTSYSGKTTTLSANQTITGDYFSASDNVILSGIVEGDAYIAGGTLTVDGTVNNDLMAAGGNLLITGSVGHDVRIAGGNITFSGAEIGGNITVLGGQILIDSATVIGGSVVSAGGNIQILASVPSEINVAGGSVIIGNFVGGDTNAAAGELSLTNNAAINGDLTYWSENDANISESASVSGVVTRELPPNYDFDGKEIVDGKAIAKGLAGAFFLFKLIDTIMLLVVGLIFIALFPVYSDRIVKHIKTRFGMSLLLGLAAVILIPVLALILMVTFFGIPLGILLIVLYAAMLWFVRIFALLIIGRFILDKTNNKGGSYWALIIGVVIYFILGFLPIISFITDLLILLTGVGGLLAVKKQLYTELRNKKLI